MREEKFDASVPVCVEIDPTVMEVEVTPGAPPPEDAAPRCRGQRRGTRQPNPGKCCRRRQQPDSMARSHTAPVQLLCSSPDVAITVVSDEVDDASPSPLTHPSTGLERLCTKAQAPYASRVEQFSQARTHVGTWSRRRQRIAPRARYRPPT